MSTATLAESERSDLCNLMLHLGAEAPTLNEGWQVLDLAAHLVAREHDLWAAPGLVLGGVFASAMNMAMGRRRRQGLEKLISKIRRGAPLLWSKVPAAIQLNEYYLHHEDVRRANGLGPREDLPELDERLGRLVSSAAPNYLKKFDGGVALISRGETIFSRGPEPRATLEGPPGELLLYLSGRRSAARVVLGGDPAVAERLNRADLAI